MVLVAGMFAIESMLGLLWDKWAQVISYREKGAARPCSRRMGQTWCPVGSEGQGGHLILSAGQLLMLSLLLGEVVRQRRVEAQR